MVTRGYRVGSSGCGLDSLPLISEFGLCFFDTCLYFVADQGKCRNRSYNSRVGFSCVNREAHQTTHSTLASAGELGGDLRCGAAWSIKIKKAFPHHECWSKVKQEKLCGMECETFVDDATDLRRRSLPMEMASRRRPFSKVW